MSFASRRGQMITQALVICAALLSAGVYSLTPSQFKHECQVSKTEVLPVPYQEFKTTLVREKVTEQLMNRDGITILHEEVIDRKVDLSRDRRPLLNALVRRSKANVSQTKRYTLRLDSDDIGADKVSLEQVANITPQETEVETYTTMPAGYLQAYECVLNAEPHPEGTQFTYTITLNYERQLPSVAHAVARERIETRLNQYLSRQTKELSELVVQSVADKGGLEQ